MRALSPCQPILPVYPNRKPHALTANPMSKLTVKPQTRLRLPILSARTAVQHSREAKRKPSGPDPGGGRTYNSIKGTNYFAERRRAMRPRPNSPLPNSAMVPGSGTSEISSENALK